MSMGTGMIYLNKKLTLEYSIRFEKHIEELKWLYMELYPNQKCNLCDKMLGMYKKRTTTLKRMDRSREKDANWYKSNQYVGMMLYTNAFAGDLQGVRKHLAYLEETGINYVHLMPLLDTVDERSDGGYAVADFRKIKSELGTMADFEQLTQECHQKCTQLFV